MKKFLLGLVVLGMLSACSLTKTVVDMPYGQANLLFRSQIFSGYIFSFGSLLSGVDAIKEIVDVTVTADQKNFSTQSSFHIVSDSVLQTLDSQSDMSFAIGLWDNVLDRQLNTSGTLTYSSIQSGLYLLLSSFVLDMGAGSAEASLVRLLVKDFLGKPIQLDDPSFSGYKANNYMMTRLYTLPFDIHRLFQQYDLFVLGAKTSYEGYIAYQIKEQPEALSGFVQTLFADPRYQGLATLSGLQETLRTMHLDGLLVIEGSDAVRLIITNWTIGSGIVCTGNIGKTDGSLSIVVHNESTRTLSWKNNDPVLRVFVGKSMNEQGYDVSISLDPRFANGKAIVDIQGSIGLKNIWQGQQSVQLGFEGKYGMTPLVVPRFVAPNSPLLYSQLFGDEYQLSSLFSTGLSLDSGSALK